jgi:hypothetical protein
MKTTSVGNIPIAESTMQLSKMPVRPANRWISLCLAIAIMASACAPPREPVPLTPRAETAGAAVVRRPIPETPPALTVTPPGPSAQPVPAPPIVLPPNTQYVCVSEVDGERRQTAIEFSSKVAALCRTHPEMGPCQYERNLCRRSGGRVYAAGGVEITTETEAEYDRKVMRVRFKSN